MVGTFKPGDIVCGLPESNEHYGITNTDMTLGLVFGGFTRKDEAPCMFIIVLGHKQNAKFVGHKTYVLNDDALFKKVGELSCAVPEKLSSRSVSRLIKNIRYTSAPAISILF